MLTVHHSQHVPTALLFGKLALSTPFPCFLRSLYFKYTFGAFLVESTEQTPLQIITLWRMDRFLHSFTAFKSKMNRTKDSS